MIRSGFGKSAQERKTVFAINVAFAEVGVVRVELVSNDDGIAGGKKQLFFIIGAVVNEIEIVKMVVLE